MRLRVGRKIGRTIYEQIGSEPSDTDPLIGVMDTAYLARVVVIRWNQAEDANKATEHVADSAPAECGE